MEILVDVFRPPLDEILPEPKILDGVFGAINSGFFVEILSGKHFYGTWVGVRNVVAPLLETGSAGGLRRKYFDVILLLEV